MNYLKSMLVAAALALPFSVLGGESVAIDVAAAAPATVEVDGQAPEGYNCCWTFVNGRWWCVPCG